MGEASLTRLARELSDRIATLDVDGRKAALDTVHGVVAGAIGLGRVPGDVADLVESILFRIMSKGAANLFRSADAKAASMSRALDELRQGASVEVLAMLDRAMAR